MHSKQTSKGFYFIAVLILLDCSIDSQSIEGKFDLSFEYEPRDDVISLGSTVILNCSAPISNNALPKVKVSWYMNGYLLKPARNHRLLQNGSLKITNFSNSHVGEYLCLLSSGQLARLSKSVTIELAAISSFNENAIRNLSFVEGDNALFHCEPEGPPVPHVFWTKNFQAIPLDDDRMLQLPSNNLHLSNVTPNDEGTYRCHASNVAGSIISAKYEVTVSRRVSPTAINQLALMQPVESHVGRTALLECLWSFSGSVWLRDDSKLEHLPKLSSSLSIRNSSFSDSGVYKCQSLQDERASSEISLTVFAPPVLMMEDEVRVNMGTSMSFNLTCTYVGHPTPEVRWFKNGKKLQEKIFRMRINHTVIDQGCFIHQSEVLVHHSIPSDVGVYQCLVFNHAGSRDVTFFVSAIKPVFLIPAPQNLKAKPMLNKEIELSWDPPDDVKDVSGYSIHYWSFQDDREMSLMTERTRETIIHLSPFTNYTFYVKTHAYGEVGEPSQLISQMTNEEVPVSVPQVTVRSEGMSEVVLQWSRLIGRQANGVIVGHKILQRNFKDLSNKTFLVDGQVYNFTLKDLEPENRYDVLVLSGTKVGFPDIQDVDEELWQTIFLSADKDSPLYHPKDLNVEVINSSMALISWKVRHVSDSIELYGFRIQCQSPGKKSVRLFTRDSDRSYYLGDLEPGRSYEIQVQSISQIGSGTPANFTFVMPPLTATTIGRRMDASVVLKGRTINDTTILLTLVSPEAHGSDHVEMCYDVCRMDIELACPESGGTIRVDEQDEVLVSNLMPLTKYCFRVQGSGGWQSTTVAHFTGPPAPKDVEYVDMGDERLNITWRFPENSEDVWFKVSYTNYANNPLSNWSHVFVHGSTMHYVLENYTGDVTYFVRVASSFHGVEISNDEILQVNSGSRNQGQIASDHPVSFAMVTIIVVVGVVVTAVIAVLLSSRRFGRGKHKDCFTKQSTQTPFGEPLQANLHPDNASPCNGDNHHHRRCFNYCHGKAVTSEPLLDKRGVPASYNCETASLPHTQDDPHQIENINESTV